MGVELAIHAQLAHQLFRLDQVESHLIEPAFKPTAREFFLNLVFGVVVAAQGTVGFCQAVARGDDAPVFQPEGLGELERRE